MPGPRTMSGTRRAFPQSHPFAPRSGSRDSFPSAIAVGGGEDDAGVFGATERIERLEKLADGRIEVLGHGGAEDRVLAVARVGDFREDRIFFVALAGFLRGLIAGVGRVVGNLDKEGAAGFGLTLDEIDAAPGNAEHQLGIVRRVVGGAGFFVGVAGVLVVAVLGRAAAVEMPLAESAGRTSRDPVSDR